MPNAFLLKRLEKFLEQSRELLRLAQEDNWEEFESLLNQRQEKLASLGENEFLIELAKAGLADDARELINAIRALDAQILQRAESGKADIGAKLRQSLQANKAIVAYKS